MFARISNVIYFKDDFSVHTNQFRFSLTTKVIDIINIIGNNTEFLINNLVVTMYNKKQHWLITFIRFNLV